MSGADDAELARLQQRVFGPDADRHHDAEAIARLRELEAARRGPDPVAVGVASVEPTADATRESLTQPDFDEPAEPPRPGLLERLRGVRRSTVLIALAAVALVVAAAVAFVLVERVQTDPLQTGAEQVARLTVDENFRVPDLFRGGPDGEGQVTGFEAYLGLRPVVTEGGFFGAGATAPCLAVYPDADIDDPTATSFSGPVVGGCAVGVFPAVTQFGLVDGFPEELREAFPEGTGFQFVFDRENNEVVVFAG